MRSDDVFAASKNISNRFLLCRIASVSARRLQTGPKQFTESINKSFKVIASMAAPQGEKGAGEFPITFDLSGVNSGASISPSPLGPDTRVSPGVGTIAAR